jgi:hypothetical protein
MLAILTATSGGTNGTKGDPVFVAETGRDALADAPWWMVSVGETLFFTSAEHELWRSDGTANGMTKIVTDAEFIHRSHRSRRSRLFLQWSPSTIRTVAHGFTRNCGPAMELARERVW